MAPHSREHPYLDELRALYQQQRISRRTFLHQALLLGMSLGAAAACAPPPTLSTLPATPSPRATPTPSGPLRGGTLRVSSRVMPIDHPARFEWFGPRNQMAQIMEYLTFTGNDNLTRPYLLERWTVDESLRTWTLFLRQGIHWNNGDRLEAEDVRFSIQQWLDPGVESSMRGLMSYLSPTNIELLDAHTIRLHLDSPQIALPEHLSSYPAQLLNHRTFEGDLIAAPVGTGPFVLKEFQVGERVLLERRTDYWQWGEDGQPLPYLDRILFLDLGEDIEDHIAALQAREVDRIDMADQAALPVYQALRNQAGVRVTPITTAQTRVLRMRVDRPPWTDNRVVQAMKLCQQREKILQQAFDGEGAIGQDFHVSPVHPEYCPQPIPPYDPERARHLLQEAGYPDGLNVTLTLGSGWTDVVRYGELLKEGAAPAGFRIQLDVVPNSDYWTSWDEVDFGITPWGHRPLGTMILALAYVADEAGEPVPWNESRWVDPTFTTLLRQADGTLDVEERRKLFCQLEQIQLERGPIGLAYWMNQWDIVDQRVQGTLPHPNHYDSYTRVWYDPSL